MNLKAIIFEMNYISKQWKQSNHMKNAQIQK